VLIDVRPYRAIAFRAGFVGLVCAAVVCACSQADRPAPGASAGPGAPSDPGIAEGPCNDGAVRECHVPLGDQGRVRTCFDGTQVCTGDTWGNCGGAAGTIRTTNVGDSRLTPTLAGTDGVTFAHTASISLPSKSAAACANNPCNPYCVGYDEDGGLGLTPEGGSAGPPYTGVPGTGNVPAYFVDKGLCDVLHPPCPACTGPSSCQFDYQCDIPSGKCVKWLIGQALPSGVCPGINLTQGVACSNSGNISAPLCNRGNTALAANTAIEVKAFVGSSVSFPTTNCAMPAGTVKGTCTANIGATPLNPGECRTMNYGSCAVDFSGDTALYVNSNLAVPECGMPSSPGCSDNWSFYSAPGTPCSPITGTVYPVTPYQQDYEAKCPVGAHGQWSALAYDTTTPKNTSGTSSVKFEVQTAPRLATGLPGTFVPASPVLAADAPSMHPSVCPMSGPSPCPRDLFAILGAVQARNEFLRLKVTLTPTPDKYASPTLKNWMVSFSCVPAE
jgi:hypothetical protein